MKFIYISKLTHTVILFILIILSSQQLKSEELIVHYKFDKNWSKNTALFDSMGTADADLIRDPVTRVRSPKEGLKPDTNYAGKFDGGGFDIHIPGLPSSPVVSFAFWMKIDSSKDNQYGHMPIAFKRYDLWITDGSIGFNTSNSDIWGTSSSGLNDSWHYIAAVFHRKDVTKNKLYIDGELMSLSQRREKGALSQHAKISTHLRISGWHATHAAKNNYSFYGHLDELKIYKGEISQETIDQNIGTSKVDHYRLEYNSVYPTCEKAKINVKACADSRCSKLFTERPVDIKLTNSVNTVSAKINGSSFVEIDSIKPRTYTLDVTSKMNPSMDKQRCFRDGVADSSCTYSSSSSGLIFNVPTLISGKPSENISIRAISRASNENQCISALSGRKTVNFKIKHLSTFHNNATTDISGTAVSTSETPVTLDFDNTGRATFKATHKQAGKLALSAALRLKSGQILRGGDEFVSKPLALFLLPYFTTIEQATCPSKDASCSVYKAAGDNFTLQAKAVQWVSDEDKDFSDNPAIEGFVLDDIRVTHNLVAPAGGEPGTIPDVRFNYTNHQGLHNINGLSVSEVGVFEFDLQPPLYFGQRITTVKTPPMGRFTPAYLTLQTDRGELENKYGSFRYIGEEFGYKRTPKLVFKAFSGGKNPTVTKNYHGRFAKLLYTRSLDIDSIVAPVVNGKALEMTINAAATQGRPHGRYGLIEYNLNPSAVFNYVHNGKNLIKPGTHYLKLKFLNLHDSDNVSVRDHRTLGLITMPYTFPPVGQPELRFGRIHIENNHGSELQPLTIPITARYFDGKNWAINTEDQYTKIDLSRDLKLVGNVTSKATLTDNNPMNKGRATLTLAPPKPTGTGIMDISSNLTNHHPWLLSDIDGDGQYDNEVKGRATFGLYNQNPKVVYWREIFQ